MFDANKTRMIGLPYGEINCDNMLSRFHRRLACDGRTDRIAISLSRVSMLTRNKNACYVGLDKWNCQHLRNSVFTVNRWLCRPCRAVIPGSELTVGKWQRWNEVLMKQTGFSLIDDYSASGLPRPCHVLGMCEVLEYSSYSTINVSRSVSVRFTHYSERCWCLLR